MQCFYFCIQHILVMDVSLGYMQPTLVFFLRFYLYFREGKRERGRCINWLPLTCPQLGACGWPHNPGMCPDPESNQ